MADISDNATVILLFCADVGLRMGMTTVFKLLELLASKTLGWHLWLFSDDVPCLPL